MVDITRRLSNNTIIILNISFFLSMSSFERSVCSQWWTTTINQRKCLKRKDSPSVNSNLKSFRSCFEILARCLKYVFVAFFCCIFYDPKVRAYPTGPSIGNLYFLTGLLFSLRQFRCLSNSIFVKSTVLSPDSSSLLIKNTCVKL